MFSLNCIMLQNAVKQLQLVRSDFFTEEECLTVRVKTDTTVREELQYGWTKHRPI